MARSEPIEAKAGCLKRLIFMGLFLASLVLLLAVALVLVPQDLTDVEGLDASSGKAARDLKTVLSESVQRGHEVTLSEAEINRWLATRVVMEQKGMLAKHVKRGQVMVRLEKGVAELIVLREVFGRSLTFSAFMQVEVSEKGSLENKVLLLHGGPYVTGVTQMTRGGRFGRLVVPQGYLRLLLPTLRALAASCEEEIHFAFEEMVSIRIEEGRLILNPRSREALREEGLR